MRSFSEYLEVVQEGKNNNNDLLKFKDLNEEIKHYEDQLSMSSANPTTAMKKLVNLYAKKNTSKALNRKMELELLLKGGSKALIDHYEDQLSQSSANQSAIPTLIDLYTKYKPNGFKVRIQELKKQLK